MPHNFYQKAQDLFAYTQGLRRDFHLHPELGFQEVRTAGIVARELQNLGLEVSTGVGKTGVVAMIEGSQPGPTLLLRADMDALPILEETQTEYTSQTQGVMHACGHDGHTAILLTVAKMLHEIRADLPGNIKLVFQPAEEGLGGAEAMLADGVLDNPKVDFSLGLHLWNDKPVGWLGIAPGPTMAGAEKFKITVRGKGGHGAAPHLTIDPILAGAHIVTALQSIVSRNVEPLQGAVVSVTYFKSGEAMNVIPPYAEMGGTIRTFAPAVREIVMKRFDEVIRNTAAALGCEVEVEPIRMTPAVINDAALTELAQNSARSVFPDAEIDASAPVTMGSEDFAYLMQSVPGLFMFVGSANAEKGLNYGHHHPKFDIDEASLPRATALMAQTAFDILKR
jgi:amidohydrolase